MVSKVLRTLPMRYDLKVSTLKEWDDIEKLTIDEVHGILTAYEMRKWQNWSSRKEADFKASLKKSIRKPKWRGILFNY